MRFVFKIFNIIFYPLIIFNIFNLWFVTDKYQELNLTRKQKDVYFGFIICQLVMLNFLTRKKNIFFTNILMFFNIIFGLISALYLNILLVSTTYLFFEIMNGVYIIWWFICSIGFLIYIAYYFMENGYEFLFCKKRKNILVISNIKLEPQNFTSIQHFNSNKFLHK
jgi:hypothetical protein